MCKILEKLFCLHDWEKIHITSYPDCDVVLLKCKKCGVMPYVTLVYEFLSDTEKKEAAAKAWNRRT